MFENRHALIEEETRIHEMIREMYQHATNAMEQAIESLMSQDSAIAETVVKQDNKLNELTCQVEKECLMAVATQQPTPQDVLDIIASLAQEGGGGIAGRPDLGDLPVEIQERGVAQPPEHQEDGDDDAR